MKKTLLSKELLCLLLILATFALGCSEGFDSAQTLSEPETEDPQSTTTTTLHSAPPTTERQQPPGGSIFCAAYGGGFPNREAIIKFAEDTNDSSCIRINGTTIKSGFGPCVECRSDDYTPPTTTTRRPTTTTRRPTTTTTGWPTTTTRPGGTKPFTD